MSEREEMAQRLLEISRGNQSPRLISAAHYAWLANAFLNCEKRLAPRRELSIEETMLPDDLDFYRLKSQNAKLMTALDEIGRRAEFLGFHSITALVRHHLDGLNRE